MKKLLAECMAVMLVSIAFFCLSSVCAQQVPVSHLRVVTTLFPLYDWARVIGGEQADVSLLLPPGVEPHGFEPTPRDITAINKADLLIYTGEFMEPWVADILRGLTNKNLTAVDTSRGIELLTGDHDAEHMHSAEEEKPLEEGFSSQTASGGGQVAAHGEVEGHRHEGADPHIWLELGNAQRMVNHIAAAFAEKDPVNRQLYLDRAREYNDRLKALDADFEKSLSQCKHRTIIYGGHFAFGYFARRYGLKYVSPYSGFSPNAEPSPKRIAELIENMKKLNVKYIFYEENIEPRVARVVAEETGARLLLLHGAHNVSKDELAGGATYISIMEGNLNRLKQGLECP